MVFRIDPSRLPRILLRVLSLILLCCLFGRFEVPLAELGQETVPRLVCEFRVFGELAFDHEFLGGR